MSDPSIRHEHDSDEPAAAADDSVTVERDSSAGDVSLDGVDESLSPLHPAGGDDVPEAAEFSVESLLDDLERVTKERDGYLDDTRRVAADFANFRRQTEKRHSEVVSVGGAQRRPRADLWRAGAPVHRHGSQILSGVAVTGTQIGAGC